MKREFVTFPRNNAKQQTTVKARMLRKTLMNFQIGEKKKKNRLHQRKFSTKTCKGNTVVETDKKENNDSDISKTFGGSSDAVDDCETSLQQLAPAFLEMV